MSHRLNKHWVMAHWRDITDIPRPGEKWQVANVDGLEGDQKALSSNGVVKVHQRSEYGQPCMYETREEAYEYLQTCIDRYGGDPNEC